ncbi:hypothetical protein Peetri_00038 [Pseudomonas phage vB_PpuM-Peetri]
MKRFLFIVAAACLIPLGLKALVESDGTVVHIPFLAMLMMQFAVAWHAGTSYDMLFPEGKVRGR